MCRWTGYCFLVRNLETYGEDTNHALRIFNDFHFDNTTTGERFLYTMDIKSLYTVIPNKSGLEALAYFQQTSVQFSGHSIDDTLVRGMMLSVDNAQRKRLEMRLIFQLGTSQQRGLNSDFRFL